MAEFLWTRADPLILTLLMDKYALIEMYMGKYKGYKKKLSSNILDLQKDKFHQIQSISELIICSLM